MGLLIKVDMLLTNTCVEMFNMGVYHAFPTNFEDVGLIGKDYILPYLMFGITQMSSKTNLLDRNKNRYRHY